MDIKPLTSRGRETIVQSLDHVAHNKHAYVGIEHLLLVITTPNSDVAVTKHQELREPCARIRQIVSDQIVTGDSDGSRSVPQTHAAKQALLNSQRIAGETNNTGVNPEHLLLAILEFDSESLVKQILDDDLIEVSEIRKLLTTFSELDTYPLPIPPKFDG